MKMVQNMKDFISSNISPQPPLPFLFQMLVLILFQNVEILEVPDKSLRPHAESIVLYALHNPAILLYPAYIVTPHEEHDSRPRYLGDNKTPV